MSFVCVFWFATGGNRVLRLGNFLMTRRRRFGDMRGSEPSMATVFRDSSNQLPDDTARSRSVKSLACRREYLTERVSEHHGLQDAARAGREQRDELFRIEGSGAAQDDADDEIETSPQHV